MSLKNSHTTSDYLPWKDANRLVDELWKKGEIRMSLLVYAGMSLGLRYSDLSKLTWNQLLSEDRDFFLTEKKTGKYRKLRVNENLQSWTRKCSEALAIKNYDRPCFVNRYGGVWTIRGVNMKFKDYKTRYGLHLRNFSTHSLRKTFGRRVMEQSKNPETALVFLMEIFNHSNITITKRYLGIRQEEIDHIYDTL